MGRRRAKGRAGFTLLEVIIAMSILAVGLLAIASAQLWAITRTGQSRHQTEALNLASQKMEEFHHLPMTSPLLVNGADAAPIDPDPNDLDITTFQRSWGVQNNTPVAGLMTITVTVFWTDQNGTVLNTVIQSMKAL
jgi:type IV pilus assembly protein PilV